LLTQSLDKAWHSIDTKFSSAYEQNGYPKQDMETMREAMTDGGWQRTEHMPAEWFLTSGPRSDLKKRNLTDTNIVASISPQGMMVFIRKQIADFWNKEGNGIPIILALVASSRSRATNWFNNPSLPKGWTMRTGSYGKRCKNPNEQMFSSKI
jgi:hypothetical protein